ncbi:extensin isoform X2 [Trichoplusia ni]|uniref:Extensin isoform X2 n=1 Tax=Trichoplusia ni TaxID=7111 RepID=A0A7E5W8T8_TRINI|nr:extensin isoform X2 [Trichoplusia ni]
MGRIDFNNPGTDKPANLANSAVLRMLEEEERNRRGLPKLDETQVQAILENMVYMRHPFDNIWPPEGSTKSRHKWQLTSGHTHSEFVKATKGQKKVVWPPVPETNGYHQTPQQQSPAFYNNAQQSPASPQPQYQAQPQPQYQAPPQPQPQYQQQPAYQQPQYHQQPTSPQPQYQAPESEPSFCEGRRQEPTGLSKLIPVGPGVTAPYRPGPPSPGIVPQPYRQQQSRWAPVPAPLSPQIQGSQPGYPGAQYSPQPQYSPSYSEPSYQAPQKPYEPPPATITLRQQQPVHQKPPPVFASQPATASFQGGINMRGDQKWPPQSVKEAVAAENEARRQLARGPACRPRKVNKDYSTFFAQHALSHNYPGYRAPPGTQHYDDNSGRSSY